VIDVDDIRQVPSFLVPEAIEKRRASSLEWLAPAGVEIARDIECIQPKRLDFHRLSDPRGDDSIANSSVHPGQLNPRNTGRQQPRPDPSAPRRALPPHTQRRWGGGPPPPPAAAALSTALRDRQPVAAALVRPRHTRATRPPSCTRRLRDDREIGSAASHAT